MAQTYKDDFLATVLFILKKRRRRKNRKNEKKRRICVETMKQNRLDYGTFSTTSLMRREFDQASFFE